MNNIVFKWKILLALLPFLLGDVSGQPTGPVTTSSIQWGDTVAIQQITTINRQNEDCHTAPDLNAAKESLTPGGESQYCRLLSLGQNKWLAVYTVGTNSGYQRDPKGGLRLEIAQSADNGRTWNFLARLKDPGRDLDNGQLIRLKNGHILLACRSVRWQSSYRLPVYESADGGLSWRYLSLIDSNEGPDGSLGNPDKGVYEPHFVLLKDNQLAVFYANEKHVTETRSFSQIISEKISKNNGESWGEEIWVAHDPQNEKARPGMPVCTEMGNGAFMVVYEVCGTQSCNIYQKTSKDGKVWKVGIGTSVPGQTGAPYVLSMSDKTLIVTSNRGRISLSRNYGRTWNEAAGPWRFSTSYEQDWKQALWPALYQFGPRKIGAVAALQRDGHPSGHDVKIRFGQEK